MIRPAWRSSTDAVQQEMPDLTKLLGSIGLVAAQSPKSGIFSFDFQRLHGLHPCGVRISGRLPERSLSLRIQPRSWNLILS
jgi:hypothetical protein